MASSFDPTKDYPGTVDPDITVDARNWSVPFTNLTPHARGGLGEVFRATDPELHRTVAVKCLQDRHAESPDNRQRFLLEAEVTARLEHPGVVPVYRLIAGGTRPAYAMRFVEGETFAEAIATYHAAPSDPVAFRRLLQAFLQVCQTVAYAHSRGVIHRDLKPANVMIGKFGETLVVDWGLAKVVGRPEEVRATGIGETLVPSSCDSGPGETAMGSAVGTPAYMSPEQAAGRWDVVAQASDVYGLGAVLYTVLSGKPPIERGNWPEMQQRIQRGDFPRPRQLQLDVPRPLEEICLKAMALEPQDRYASATALGTEVEHWLADEPVTAYREPTATRAWRWAKRHRTLVSAAAVLLLASVVGLSVGAVLLQQARIETDGQRKVAVTAQQKAEAINRFLVDDLLKQADPVNNPVGEKLTVRQLLDKASEKLDAQTNLVEQPEVEAEVRAVIGHAYEFLGVYSKAERHYHRAWDLRSQLSGLGHAETLVIRNRFVWAVVVQGRRPDAEGLASAALDECTRVLGDAHPETADAANNLAEAYTNLAVYDKASVLRRRASKILNATLGPNDNKTMEIDNNLAITLILSGNPDEARSLLQSVTDRRRRINPRDSELATTLGNLGGALIGLGRFTDAERPLQEAIALGSELLGQNNPGTLGNRNLFCYALEGQGRWAEAKEKYLAVLVDRRRIEVEESSKDQTLRTVGFLARLYAKQERWPDAAPYLAELILAEKPEPKRTIDGVAPFLASALTGKADPASAEPQLRECWEVVKVRMWTGDWLTGEVASRYGDCLTRQGKYEEAEPILLAAARDITKAVGVPAWGIAAARKRVAELYDAWKKPTEAAKWR